MQEGGRLNDKWEIPQIACELLIEETPEKISGLVSDFHSAKEGCHAVTHSSLYLLTYWDDILNPYGNT